MIGDDMGGAGSGSSHCGECAEEHHRPRRVPTGTSLLSTRTLWIENALIT